MTLPDLTPTAEGFWRYEWEWYAFWGALLVVLLVLWYLVRKIRQPRELLAFRTERGEVTVVRRAIAELIQKAAARTPGVYRCKSRIRKRGDKLRIRLNVQLRANHDLREVERRLEHQISEMLGYSLGFSSIGRIDMRITRIVGEPDAVIRYEDKDELPERPAPGLRPQTPAKQPNRDFTTARPAPAPVREDDDSSDDGPKALPEAEPKHSADADKDADGDKPSWQR